MATDRETFIREKMARHHFWEAFDQGGLAFHDGTPLSANPWRVPVTCSHVNVFEWERGWRAEEASQAPYTVAA